MTTKAEFVDKVAEKSGLSKKDAGAAVDAVISSIEDSLSAGDEVSFTGSASSTSRTAGPARAATRGPARRWRSRPSRCPSSAPARS